MKLSGLAMLQAVTTGPGTRLGTMAVTVGTVAGMIPGIITIPCSMAAGGIMATMDIMGGIHPGPIDGMIPIGTDHGTTETIIPPMLSAEVAIIMVVRPLAQVLSVVTARPLAVIAEVPRPITAVARVSCVTGLSTVAAAMAGPAVPIRVPILTIPVIMAVTIITAVIVTPEATATLVATPAVSAAHVVPALEAAVEVLAVAVAV